MAQIKRKSEADKKDELIRLRELAERDELTAGNINLYQLDLLQELEDSGDITEKEQAALTSIRAHLDEQQKKFEASEEYKSFIKNTDSVNEKINYNFTLNWNDLLDVFKLFDKKHGETIKKYHSFCTIIERELYIRKQPSNLWAAAEATKAYVKAYNKLSAPTHSEQLTEEDKAEIKKFLDEYLSEDKKTGKPPNAEPAQELLELDGFIRMLQGTGTNQLAQMSSRRMKPQIDPITGTATVSYNNFTAYIENFDGSLGHYGLMFIDVCAMYFTENNHYGDFKNLITEARIPLKKYMELCGIPLTKASKDKTRRELKKDLATLYNMDIEFDELKNGKKTEHYHTRILQAMSDINNGIIYAKFTQDFIGYLNSCGIMDFSVTLLRAYHHSPSAYLIGRKLCLHSSMDNNRKRGTANKISVTKLLDCCPDIPSHKEVKETGRAFERRIIKPLEATLDALKDDYGILSSWEYCNSKGAALTEEQLDNSSYNTAIDLLIKFEIKNAPDHKDRLAAKAETDKKANARKQAAINKAHKKKAETTTPKSEG